jgi:hypothetical protein
MIKIAKIWRSQPNHFGAHSRNLRFYKVRLAVLQLRLSPVSNCLSKEVSERLAGEANLHVTSSSLTVLGFINHSRILPGCVPCSGPSAARAQYQHCRRKTLLFL